MRRLLTTLWAIGLAATAAGGWQTADAQIQPEAFRSGEVIIKFRPGTTPAARQAILADLQAADVRPLRLIGAEVARVRTVPVEQAVARYSAHAAVEFIEPNYECRIAVTPNDPHFDRLWGMHNTGQSGGTPGADIRATLAWDVTTGSSGVLVAIIDTGIDYNHPDLAPNIHLNPGEIPGNGIDDDGNGFVDDVRGWDFFNDDSDPMDDHGHGTHCAGTVGAIGNNGIGVAGVCWNVRLLPLKFLGDDGRGTMDGAIRSIEYAIGAGVRVMSNSWSGGAYSEALYQAIRAADDAGIVFVAAAGNAALNTDLVPAYPSAYDLSNIVAVAASDRNDRPASFTNYGFNTVDLAAPGQEVLSTTRGGGYAILSGTSMATPHVSGAFALVLSRFPGLGVAEAKQRIFSQVERLPALAGKVATGGRLNAYRALADRDSVPPAAISDLGVAAVEARRITIEWTATGDDGAAGRVAGYDVRHSVSPITAATFDSVSRADGPSSPLPSGGRERVEIRGLSFSTRYYVAVRAIDEWGNLSQISNVATGTTLEPPEIEVGSARIAADLATGGRRTLTVTIENQGPGELSFDVFAIEGGVEAARPAARAVPEVRAGIPNRDRAVIENAAGLEDRAGLEGRAGPPDEPLARAPIPFAPEAAPRRGLIQPPPASAEAPANGMRLIILKWGANVSEIQALLAGYPGTAAVDTLDVGRTAPTLDQLSPYDAALVITSLPFRDRVEFGNVLADFVDLGRGLVLTLPSFVASYQIEGRLLTEGYAPFEIGVGPIGSFELGSFEVGHPIMDGVSAATGDLVCDVALQPGAQLVASWQNGKPCVATRGDRVAAINAFVGWSGFWTGDMALIVHNAAVWSTRAPGWIEVSPRRGAVPGHGRLDLEVTFDATGLSGGDYEAAVLLVSDDPDESRTPVAASLRVGDAPDLLVESAPAMLESTVEYTIENGQTSHTLAFERPPSGSGSIELVAEGGFANPTQTATAYVEGTPVGTVGRTGLECSTASGSFRVGAEHLAQIAADGHADIEVRNSPDVGSGCPVNRHRVRLHYTPPIDPLDFGSVRMGDHGGRIVLVRNRGTKDLHVRAISSDQPAFDPMDAGRVTIPPGAVEELAIRFTPTRAGSFSGTLSIESDDPDHPMARFEMRGQGAPTPPIVVGFDLEASVIHGGRHGLKWVEGRIQVPPPHSAAQIVLSSIRINGLVGIDRHRRVELRDRNRDGIPDLLEVRFSRRDLALILSPGDSVPVVVTGKLGKHGTFEGRDVVEVRRGTVRHPRKHDHLASGQIIQVRYDAPEAPATTVTLLSSIDGGASWRTERAGQPNSGTIDWQVPAAPAEDVLLAVVEIEPGPGPGEVLQVLGVSEPFSIVGTVAVEGSPASLALDPLAPNPARGPVAVRYALPSRAAASLRVYDLQGRVVRTLHDGAQEAGRHEARWDGRSEHGTALGAGIYFIRLEVGASRLTRSVVLLR